MSRQDEAGEKFYTYAMELLFRTGHVATLNPEFINHSPEQFAYFDNKSDIAFSHEQRTLFRTINNISRLFTANGCAFFSINLITSKSDRSQVAHDIHMMFHPIVQAEGTICLFRFDDEIMLSFTGFGLHCVLSDWYSMVDSNEALLKKLDIANISISRGVDYFLDIVYFLARQYYLSGQPPVLELLPFNFISRMGIENVDREEVNQYVHDQINSPQIEYGDDYVDYDDSLQALNTDIGADLDLMLLEMDDDEDDNPFGEELEPEEDFEDEEFFDGDQSTESDEYEFADVDPEIFRDPTLMVKWLNKLEQASPT